MAKQTRTTLKTYFETGNVPTEAQFIDLIDSVSNITDDGVPELKWYITTNVAIETTGNYTILAADAGSFFAITKLILIRTATGASEINISLKHNGSAVGSTTTYFPNGVGGYTDFPIYTTYGYTLDLTYPLVIVGSGATAGTANVYLQGIKYTP